MSHQTAIRTQLQKSVTDGLDAYGDGLLVVIGCHYSAAAGGWLPHVYGTPFVSMVAAWRLFQRFDFVWRGAARGKCPIGPQIVAVQCNPSLHLFVLLVIKGIHANDDAVKHADGWRSGFLLN